MNKTVLNKDVKIEDNKVVITESIETIMDRSQLEMKLRDVQMQKLRAREQNARLVAEYNGLLEEEGELDQLILQLNIDDGVEVI